MIGIGMRRDDTVKMRYAEGMQICNNCRPLDLSAAVY
jgi:hypothetical protein